jgi:PAS domain S-box-containing protein
MDAIICVDSQQLVVLFNAAAEKLFGWREQDVIGQPLDRFIPEQFRALHHQHIETFSHTNVTTRSMGALSPVTGVHASGREFPIEASISHTGAGEKKLFTVIMRDISERIKAEESRASLEAQLRESHKMQAIGTLAGGIAHDFNNIIAIILNNVALAREDASQIPHALVCLERIQLAGVRARDLVRQILAFSRRQPTTRKPISLISVVEETVRLLRATLPVRLELEWHCEPGVAPVLADATQIQQALINLANNAMQAMHRGPGRIAMRLDHAVIDAALLERHLALRDLLERQRARSATGASVPFMVRLTVSDNGPGISEADQQRIFEPFFTTKPAGEGTGLGLSVVHGILAAHEGAITVDSQLGQGATFTLYLPPVEGEAKTSEDRGDKAAPAPKAGGARILYIDDETDLLIPVQLLLERRGYRVNAYTDAHQALAALRAEPASFDLVLTDYNMPGLSGLDVAREVKAIRPDLPLVVISGFIDENLHAAASAEGVRELMSKADSVETFCDAVQRLVPPRHS